MTTDPETLRALGEVKGKLDGLADLIKDNSRSTNQRLDDLKKSVDDRFADHGQRISRLENNERSTAIQTASIGVLSGLAGTALGQAFAKVLGKALGG